MIDRLQHLQKWVHYKFANSYDVICREEGQLHNGIFEQMVEKAKVRKEVYKEIEEKSAASKPAETKPRSIFSRFMGK